MSYNNIKKHAELDSFLFFTVFKVSFYIVFLNEYHEIAMLGQLQTFMRTVIDEWHSKVVFRDAFVTTWQHPWREFKCQKLPVWICIFGESPRRNITSLMAFLRYKYMFWKLNFFGATIFGNIMRKTSPYNAPFLR